MRDDRDGVDVDVMENIESREREQGGPEQAGRPAETQPSEPEVHAGEEGGVAQQEFELEGGRQRPGRVEEAVERVVHPGLPLPFEIEAAIDVREPARVVAGREAGREELADRQVE